MGGQRLPPEIASLAGRAGAFLIMLANLPWHSPTAYCASRQLSESNPAAIATLSTSS